MFIYRLNGCKWGAEVKNTRFQTGVFKRTFDLNALDLETIQFDWRFAAEHVD